jgi:hypothetical protein
MRMLSRSATNTVPLASTATPRGYLKDACVPTPFANPRFSLPASDVTTASETHANKHTKTHAETKAHMQTLKNSQTQTYPKDAQRHTHKDTQTRKHKHTLTYTHAITNTKHRSTQRHIHIHIHSLTNTLTHTFSQTRIKYTNRNTHAHTPSLAYSFTHSNTQLCPKNNHDKRSATPRTASATTLHCMRCCRQRPRRTSGRRDRADALVVIIRHEHGAVGVDGHTTGVVEGCLRPHTVREPRIPAARRRCHHCDPNDIKTNIKHTQTYT